MTRVLRDKVAIITGASSGIGRELAWAFARERVRLVLAARREEKLRHVADTISTMQGEAIAVPTDVSVPGAVARLVGTTVSHFGRIDILVNNAGYGLFATMEETTPDELRRILDVNLMGAFYGMKAVLPIMRQQGHGHIINVSSVAGRRALPYSGAYCATKFALIALSESLRVELAGSGIDVSVVCPAGTATEFFDVAENKHEHRITPMGPVQSGAEVAQAIVRVARNPKSQVITSRTGRVMVFLNALTPSLVDWAMRKAMDRIRRGTVESEKAAAASDT